MAADDGACTMPFRHDLAVLILEGDADLQRNISEVLQGQYPNLVTVPDQEAATEVMRAREIDLLVADVSDGASGGISMLRRMAAAQGRQMAVAIAETGDKTNALEAIKLGAYQCLSRPLDSRSLLAAIDGAADEVLKRAASLQTRRRLSFAHPGKRLIGNGPAMREVFQRIQLVRNVNTNVVIRGETGSGKELVALAIHRNGPRARGPFVKLNCGAIPKDLLESELFGHEKGSFTGALSQHVGTFEAADGGTILLDEIGDMPLDLQVKLLSVLQDRELQRVGGHERIPVDVRVVAATHQDLEEAIGARRFRADLYYRLHVVRIDIPPLRERKEDIPLLVQYLPGPLPHRHRAPRRGRGRGRDGAADVLRLPGQRAGAGELHRGGRRALRGVRHRPARPAGGRAAALRAAPSGRRGRHGRHAAGGGRAPLHHRDAQAHRGQQAPGGRPAGHQREVGLQQAGPLQHPLRRRQRRSGGQPARPRRLTRPAAPRRPAYR